MMQSLVDRGLVAAVPRVIRARGKQRLSILIYHRVHPVHDYMRPADPSVDEFNWQMELLSRHFAPLSLSEALALTDTGRLPERAVCVTFDDGYADNAELALPLLQRWKVPATVFVSTSFIDGGIMWNDIARDAIRNSHESSLDLSALDMGTYTLDSEAARAQSAYEIVRQIKYLPPDERLRRVGVIEEQLGAVPRDLMLTTTQLKLLHERGVEIGGHTHSHPILAEIPDETAYSEIIGGRDILAQILDTPVRYFAYPNGIPGKDYLPRHQEMVRDAGFEAAVSTRWGVSDRGSSRWELNRFTPWDKSPRKFLARLLLNLGKLPA